MTYVEGKRQSAQQKAILHPQCPPLCQSKGTAQQEIAKKGLELLVMLNSLVSS